MKVQNACLRNFTQLRFQLAQAPSLSGGGGGGGGDGCVSSERASRSQRLRSLLFFSNTRGGGSWSPSLLTYLACFIGQNTKFDLSSVAPIAHRGARYPTLLLFSCKSGATARSLSFFRRRRRNSRVADREEDKYVCPHTKRRRRRLKRIAPSSPPPS